MGVLLPLFNFEFSPWSPRESYLGTFIWKTSLSQGKWRRRRRRHQNEAATMPGRVLPCVRRLLPDVDLILAGSHFSRIAKGEALNYVLSAFTSGRQVSRLEMANVTWLDGIFGSDAKVESRQKNKCLSFFLSFHLILITIYCFVRLSVLFSTYRIQTQLVLNIYARIIYIYIYI